MKNTKALSGLKIVDGDQGMISAVFSTFGVKDSDGDVTLPGAFEDGAPVRISAYNHASWGPGVLPVGKGTIRTTDEEAILDGRIFLDTQAGGDTFSVLKQMEDLQEWSYGFDIMDSEDGVVGGEPVKLLKRLKVHEVSPVILGAGVNTRTLTVKGQGLKLSEHIESVKAEVDALTERVAEVVAKRTEKGKGLGEASLEALSALDTTLAGLRVVLAPPTDDSAEKAARDEATLLRVRHGLQEAS